MNTNVFLGIKDVLSRKKLYFSLLIIFILSSFIMIVPQNLYSSISSKDFITYMGIGDYDIRMDIQQINNIKEKSSNISKHMSLDNEVKKYSVLYTKMFSIKGNNDDNASIKVELGDHKIFPVMYTQGKAPEKDNEIALSVSNAKELNKSINDTIILSIDNKDTPLTVCGIYPDITNGGKTAKGTFSCNLDNVMWSIIYVETNKTDKNKIVNDMVKRYSSKFSYAKISPIEIYVNQTFGTTKSSVKTASYVSIVCSILISMFVSCLFIKMLISKDRYSIAVMKAIGFNNSHITIQYTTRSVFILVLGLIIGTILANTIGERIAGLLISFLGASSFKFSINPIITYVLCPAMLIMSVILSTILSTLNAGKIKLCESIKE